MNGWLDSFYVFISGAALLLAALGLWFAAIMPGLYRWSKQFFLGFFTLLLLSCLSGVGEMILAQVSGPSAVFKLLLVLEGLFLTPLLPMVAAYLLHCCGEKPRESRFFHAVLVLWAFDFILFASSAFTDAFCILSGQSVSRGPWYPVLLLPMPTISLLTLAVAIRRRKQLSHKTFLSFLVALLPVTLTLSVDLFVDTYPLVVIGYALSAVSMFILVLSDQIEQDLRRQREIAEQQREIAEQQREIAEQQREIANQRASIMVLQMRPHFIYNTMTSIYCLCKQDPVKARQVVKDFTDYLRKNFTAVASAAPIPFTSELDHTRAYLAVEQAQHAESLFVEYDTPFTFFRVPPLTLQPIVENAVKHGMDLYSGPLRILIRTRRTDSGVEIIVEDNVRGLLLADDSEPHIALKNIQHRLQMMCNGSMTIMPREGGGTVVKLTIP